MNKFKIPFLLPVWILDVTAVTKSVCDSSGLSVTWLSAVCPSVRVFGNTEEDSPKDMINLDFYNESSPMDNVQVYFKNGAYYYIQV